MRGRGISIDSIGVNLIGVLSSRVFGLFDKMFKELSSIQERRTNVVGDVVDGRMTIVDCYGLTMCISSTRNRFNSQAFNHIPYDPENCLFG